MKLLVNLTVPILAMIILGGCAVVQTTAEKISDLEYNIVNIEEVPKELAKFIDENKSTTMTLTYTDQGLEYIIVGYGAQKSSGYSVEVLEVFETENTIVVNTNLLGPSPGEEIIECATFPYVVIVLEQQEKPVLFE